MRFKLSSLCLAVSCLVCIAANSQADEAADNAAATAAADKIKDQKLKDHLMSNIDIFGKTDLPAIYIFAPGGVDEEELKGSLITRDFSRDEFFMQNIDREEFEMKVTLRDINGDDDDKKQAVKR